jgi:exonuclease SbcD
MMRFLHAADIHLDSPLRGLEDYPGAPVERIRSATRRALTKLIDLCLAERVDFLLIAGDLFDLDWRDFHTALFVAEQMRRLESAAIPVFLILGNHDSHQEMTRRTPWPSNVHLFDHKKPQTIQLDRFHVALHGMSFPKREVAENLVPEYPAPVAGWFNIGLLHTNANGSPNHDSYAPCSVEELIAKGYDYWALGHVHDYQILSERPHIVYSGNLQGRHVRELGAKGAVLVTVSDGEVSEIEFRETDVLRWFHAIVQLSEADDLDAMYERVRDRLRGIQATVDGRFVAVRLELEGRCQAHRQLVRDESRQQVITDLRALAGEFGGDLWIEKIKFRTRSPLDVEALRQGPDVLGELLRSIDAISNDTEQLAALAEHLQPLIAKVGGELQNGAGGEVIDFRDLRQITDWVRDAERILLERLVESAHED